MLKKAVVNFIFTPTLLALGFFGAHLILPERQKLENPHHDDKKRFQPPVEVKGRFS
jgi:hypothetical protein